MAGSGYRDELLAAQTRLQALERELALLRRSTAEQGDAKEARIRDLERQVDLLERDDDEAALRAALRETEARAAREQSQVQAALEEAMARIFSLEEQHTELQRERDEAVEQMTALHGEVQQAHAKLEELADSQQTQASEISELETCRSDLYASRNLVEDLRTKVSQLDDQNDQLRAELAHRERAIRQLGADKGTPTAIAKKDDADLALLPKDRDWRLLYRTPVALRKTDRALLAWLAVVFAVAGILVVLAGSPAGYGAVGIAIASLYGAWRKSGVYFLHGSVTSLEKKGHLCVIEVGSELFAVPRTVAPEIDVGDELMIRRERTSNMVHVLAVRLEGKL